MSLYNIQFKQKNLIEGEIHKLLDLLYKTEQSRDVTASPTERAKLELEIESLNAFINQYKIELQELEDEIKGSNRASRPFRTRMGSYRVQLDESLSEDQLNTEFEAEVRDLLNMMEHEIADGSIFGVTASTPPTFAASQEGDFEPLRTLFQCMHDIVDESAVISFYNVYELNRKRLGLSSGIIITNTYIAPSARMLASQYQIQILTFENLLDIIFKITRYLKV